MHIKIGAAINRLPLNAKTQRRRITDSKELSGKLSALSVSHLCFYRKDFWYETSPDGKFLWGAFYPPIPASIYSNTHQLSTIPVNTQTPAGCLTITSVRIIARTSVWSL